MCMWSFPSGGICNILVDPGSTQSGLNQVHQTISSICSPEFCGHKKRYQRHKWSRQQCSKRNIHWYVKTLITGPFIEGLYGSLKVFWYSKRIKVLRNFTMALAQQQMLESARHMSSSQQTSEMLLVRWALHPSLLWNRQTKTGISNLGIIENLGWQKWTSAKKNLRLIQYQLYTKYWNIQIGSLTSKRQKPLKKQKTTLFATKNKHILQVQKCAPLSFPGMKF